MRFTFVESRLFEKLREEYLADLEFSDFQSYLNEHPEAGDLIPASGGCRKLRWSRPGMGKRGGMRVIYYLRTATGHILLLTLYAKNVQENIQPAVLRALLEAMK